MQPAALLDEWAGLLGRLPEPLVAPAREILVIAPLSDSEVTPYAAASGDMSRRIIVPREFHWLHRLFAKARTQVEAPFQDFFAAESRLRSKEILPPEVALARIRADGLRFAKSYSPPEPLERVLDTLLMVVINQERLRAVQWGRADLDLGDPRSELETRSALRFALGHELGHHLMNHTWARPNSTRLPTEGLLRGWLNGLGVRVPRLSRPQTKELLCDAFAMMIGHERLSHESAETAWISSVMIAGGSLTSLTALDVFGEATLARETTHPLHRLRAPTHPSFDERTRFLAEVLLRVAPDHPDGPMMIEAIQRKAPGNPGGYALLVLGCATAVHELLRGRAARLSAWR